MITPVAIEPAVEDDFERQEAELLKRAAEKPTLRMIHADQARPIEEWTRLYPELALFIEVTKEDFSKIYEGKLIATAESSVEFLDLRNDFRQRHVVTLTAYGDPKDEQPIFFPTVFQPRVRPAE